MIIVENWTKDSLKQKKYQIHTAVRKYEVQALLDCELSTNVHFLTIIIDYSTTWEAMI